jgi:hypothetical protein
MRRKAFVIIDIVLAVAFFSVAIYEILKEFK